MKYIIIDSNGLELPIIFPVFWNHYDVARLHTMIEKVISAGFLKRNESGELYVTGRSQSLNLSSRKEDLDLIIKQLEFNL